MKNKIGVFRFSDSYKEVGTITLLEILTEAPDWHKIRNQLIEEAGGSDWTYEELIDKAIELGFVKYIDTVWERFDIDI